MRRIVVFAVALFSAAAAFSQSAAFVEETVNTDEATLGQAAYFSAAALGLCADDADGEDAVRALKSAGILSVEDSADDKLTAARLAWLCVCTYRTERGLFLRLFPGARYAFRELKADGIIPASYDPHRVLNGRELLAIITDCVNAYEVRELNGAAQ